MPANSRPPSSHHLFPRRHSHSFCSPKRLYLSPPDAHPGKEFISTSRNGFRGKSFLSLVLCCRSVSPAKWHYHQLCAYESASVKVWGMVVSVPIEFGELANPTPPPLHRLLSIHMTVFCIPRQLTSLKLLASPVLTK